MRCNLKDLFIQIQSLGMLMSSSTPTRPPLFIYTDVTLSAAALGADGL